MTMRLTVVLLLGLLMTGCDDSAGETAPLSSEPRLLEVFLKLGNGKPFLVERQRFDSLGRKVEESHFEKDGSGRKDRSTKYSYDAQGRESEHIDLHPDGSINFITRFIYRADDSLLSYESFDADRVLQFTLSMEYDSLGYNSRDIARKPDGTLRFWDVYERDGSGKCLVWDRYRGDSSLDHRVEYSYDSLGRGNGYVSSGSMGGTYLYEYDSLGRKWKEHAENTEDGQFLWTRIFHYREDGRIRSIEEYTEQVRVKGKPEKLYLYEYSD